MFDLLTWSHSKKYIFSGEFKSTADYQYQLLRCNVDLLKIIQLGLTFLDEKGNIPEAGPSTWQFNFKFNLTEDMYAEDSVDLLQVNALTVTTLVTDEFEFPASTVFCK